MQTGRGWRKVLGQQPVPGFWGAVVTSWQGEPPSPLHLTDSVTGDRLQGNLGAISLSSILLRGRNRRRGVGDARGQMQSLKQNSLFLPGPESTQLLPFVIVIAVLEKCVTVLEVNSEPCVEGRWWSGSVRGWGMSWVISSRVPSPKTWRPTEQSAGPIYFA